MGSGLGQPSVKWPWGLDKSLSLLSFLKRRHKGLCLEGEFCGFT